MSVLSNVSVSLAAKVVSLFLILGGTMIYARLLTPKELGVYAIVAGLSTLLAAFRNFGTSNYLIQHKNLTKQSVGSALAVTAGISMSVGLVLTAASGAMAAFFEQPTMEPVAKVLAVNFLIAPWVAVGTALLVRAHRFKALAMIEIVAGVVQAATSIALVLGDLGPLALAWGTVAHSITGLAAIAWLRLPHNTALPRFSQIGGVVRFGAWSSGAILVNQLGARGNEVVIGKQLGVDATAIFDKGLAVARLVAEHGLSEILRVLLPVFAEQRRGGVGNKDSYLHYLGILASIIAPTYAFLAVFAEPVVAILFGDQWSAAVPIAALTAIEFMIATPFLLAEKVMIAEGQVRRLFRIKLWQFVFRITALAALVNLGLVAVSVGLILAAVAYAVLIYRETARMMGVSRDDMIRVLSGPLLAAAVVAGVGLLTANSLPVAGALAHFLTLLVGAGFSLLTWLVLGALFGWPAFRVLRDQSSVLVAAAWRAGRIRMFKGRTS